MAELDQKDFETRPIWISKWRKRWDVALDNFDRSGLPFVPQPSTIIIKGDVALQIRKAIYIKGDVAFASSAIYIKGDTSLIAVRAAYFKGDTEFVSFALYVKGNTTLVVNAPLNDLGEEPPSTKPGAISRSWLNVASVTKDVT